MAPSKRNKQSGNRQQDSDEEPDQCSVRELAVFKRKRTLALNRITKTLEIGRDALENRSQTDLFLAHYSEIGKVKESFDDAHISITALSNTSEEENLEQHCDDMYFAIMALHRELDSNNGSKSSNIKLPKINLISFSGDIKQWCAFYDTFNSLIHNNKGLSDTERMHYLMSCLTGDALALVNSYPRTGVYYFEAYRALVSRYQNKRELAYTCWKEMLNVNLKASSPFDLRRILDLFNENLIILKTLRLPVDHWDFILTYMILSKLDGKTRCEFEENNSDVEFPTYIKLKEFLYSKCEAQVRDSHFNEDKQRTFNKSSFNFKSTKSSFQSKPTTSALVSNTTESVKDQNIEYSNASDSHKIQNIKCQFCQDPHTLTSCKEFSLKSVQERQDHAKENHWCFNCLKPSHQLKDCKSYFRCQQCKQKHHTLLHIDEQSEPKVSVLTNIASTSSVVLLSTANIQVLDSSGNYQNLRALIDSGSQAHFISEKAAQKLGYKPSTTSKNICGLGQSTSHVSGKILCSVGANNQTYFNIEAFTLPSICGVMPSVRFNKSTWQHVCNLKLADPDCHIPAPVDILLGAEVFMNLLLPGHIEGNEHQPSAMNTIFGWVLFGKATYQNSVSTNLCSLLSTSSDDILHQEVKKMWELEDLPEASTVTPDEILCEQKYQAGLMRDNIGRYIVSLPFKTEERPEFPGSREIALRCFHSLERRLLKNPELYKDYKEFLTDYVESGHASLVPAADIGKGNYYVPHHCVTRPDSETTKTRVVFNASRSCSNGQSLNDTLHIGAKLQGNIITVLLRFRLHNIVFIADVKQMFRQINIRPEDQDYQRIFWRFSPEEPIKEFRLHTVTYGTAAAPFLACRTIKQLVTDEGESYKLASKALNSDIYVDDVTTGASTLEQARQVKAEIVELLQKGGFELRKWASNEPSLLADVPPENCLSGATSFNINDNNSLKVLGLRWKADNFLFSVQPSERACTKRNILSEIARIFDPLGFLSPITFLAKRILQKLWIMNIGWDQPPPDEVVKLWQEYNEQMHHIETMKIPRKVTVSDVKTYQLHGFADSSEAGYGAVVYLRAIDEEGEVSTSLVCAKSRVAPIKNQSIPRLELCAAVLLTDLLQCVTVTYSDEITIEQTFAWSDSTVVLAWLRSHCSRWKTFVANRVSHIQDILPSSCWHHVPTDQNPADVASRGSLPAVLIENTLWWAGPHWLAQSTEHWPDRVESEPNLDRENIVKAEERATALLVLQPITTIDTMLEKWSSLDRLTRILAYCLRFIHNARNSSSRSVGNL